MMKFPRTYHLPFSPGLSHDDKVHGQPELFLNRDVVITEKLDGSNTLLHNGIVHSRSTNGPAKHPSFDIIKSDYVYRTFGIADHLYLYGENMYAIHSIEYGNLTDYFFLIAIYDGEQWLSWDETKNIAHACGLSHVPEIMRTRFKTLSELEKFIQNNTQKSFFGSECEGCVVRHVESFNDLSSFTSKYVRANHIQTDVHWSKNWKPAKLLTDT